VTQGGNQETAPETRARLEELLRGNERQPLHTDQGCRGGLSFMDYLQL